jgi:hypothetical protein
MYRSRCSRKKLWDQSSESPAADRPRIGSRNSEFLQDMITATIQAIRPKDGLWPTEIANYADSAEAAAISHIGEATEKRGIEADRLGCERQT